MAEQDIYIGREFFRSQRAKQVVELTSKDIRHPNSIAYHSTTLEAVQYMIDYGGLPGHTGKDYESEELPQRGDIYFLPRPNLFPFELLPQFEKDVIDWIDDESFLNETIASAGESAVAHRFCTLLGLDIAEYRSIAYFYIADFEERSSVDFRNGSRIFNSLGIQEEAIQEAYEIASKRNGIAIGLSRSALENYPISIGDLGCDFRLSTKHHGLSSFDIAAIEPIGEEEQEYFYLLRKKFEA